MAFSVGIVLFYSTRMDEVSTDFGVWPEFVTYWFNMVCPNLDLMGLTLPNYFPIPFFWNQHTNRWILFPMYLLFWVCDATRTVSFVIVYNWWCVNQELWSSG